MCNITYFSPAVLKVINLHGSELLKNFTIQIRINVQSILGGLNNLVVHILRELELLIALNQTELLVVQALNSLVSFFDYMTGIQ